MAPDDRPTDRPDDSTRRFSLRRFLLPDDEAGDGASSDLPAEAFGTVDVDDDALDAVVQDAMPDDGPALVWAANELPDLGAEVETPNSVEDDAPVSSGTDAVDARVPEEGAVTFEPTASEGEVEEAPAWEPTAQTSEEAVSSDPESGLAEATEEVTVESGDEESQAPEPMASFAAEAHPLSDTEEEARPERSPDTESDAAMRPSALDMEVQNSSEAEPHASAPDAAAEEAIAGLLAEDEGDVEAVQADFSEADAAPEAETASADSPGAAEHEGLEADGVSSVTMPEAEEPELVSHSAEDVEADATALVDRAFDEETDHTKANTASASEIDGDLDVEPLGPEDFEPEELKSVLRTMMRSRRLDDKMLTLLKQGKGYFHIGSSGHEASQAAVAREFDGGEDWFCFYYRDLATALTVGVTPTEVLRAHFGKAADPFGGGRQMPEHFGHRELNIMSTSSSVAAQYLPAVGFALAVKREDEGNERTRAVYVSGGEGSTSQGAFHEGLNWAAREALPVLFHVQDNKYAISVPVEEQTAGGSIWHLLGGYAGLKRLRYDGTDFFQAAAAARAAMAHIRAGHGPVALHADVVRLLPHSSSDDHRKYREAESLAADAARDPIPRFAARLVEAGILTDADVETMRGEVAAEIDRTAREVEAEANPDPATATAHVTYEGPDDRQYEVEGETGDLVVMVDAINHALDEELARDERVLVYGEDVGGGKGGVFTATRGLTEKHGRERCFNSPLAEHSIIGSAVGLACAGYKPVVEIQFADYIWPGMQPLRNQATSMRYRSNGVWANPMVLRIPCGGYIHGGLCHSQNVEAMFAHWPGLHVVMPSNAADAKGLLKTAIRGHDPVIFLEHKALYRQGPARRPEPHAEYLVPFGKAAIAREGTDLTIVTWGAIVYKALNAAKALEKEGVSVEVIDIRSMLPFDTETVVASVKKTGRALVAYEDHEFMGFGAEIAAQVADAAFGHLDAPVKRVAGAFSSIPYADVLEAEVLPQDADVLTAAREVLAY